MYQGHDLGGTNLSKSVLAADVFRRVGLLVGAPGALEITVEQNRRSFSYVLFAGRLFCRNCWCRFRIFVVSSSRLRRFSVIRCCRRAMFASDGMLNNDSTISESVGERFLIIVRAFRHLGRSFVQTVAAGIDLLREYTLHAELY